MAGLKRKIPYLKFFKKKKRKGRSRECSQNSSNIRVVASLLQENV